MRGDVGPNPTQGKSSFKHLFSFYIYIYIENLYFDFPKYSARYVKVERNICFENRKKLHFHPDKPVS